MQLFPRPQRVSILGHEQGEEQVAGALIGDAESFATPGDSGLGIVVDASIASQGYELSVVDGSIEIRHSDELGLRYAKDTLDQLRQQYPTGLPDLTISDWPDTQNRAFMLDISRDRVPTMRTLAWLVQILATCRYTELQLYTEHTFAFGDHEVVWRDASPMTAAEMTELDDLCAASGIELVPCLNVFGHMGPWLRHEDYQDRAECPEGFEMPVHGNHVKPLTLQPTQANADFALALVRELTSTVRSKKVNICCDEPMELGLGRSRQAVEERTKGDVFVDHLLRLMEPLIDDGYEVMFWGDMFRIHPEPLARVPKERATALAWQYDPPSEPGTGLSSLASTPELAEMFGFPADMYLGFESQTRQLVAAGYPFWAAPGTGTWNSLIGRWPHAKANLLDAVDVALPAGATGVIVTDWGDTGHMQPLSISVLPIIFGGAITWCAGANRDLPIASVCNQILGDETELIGPALEALGGISERLSRKGLNGSGLFFDLLRKPPFPATGATTRNEMDELLETLEISAAHIVNSTPTCGQTDEIKLELLAAIRLARHGLWRTGKASGLEGRSDASMHEDLTKAIALQRRAWLGRSRPGGLGHSIHILAATVLSYEVNT